MNKKYIFLIIILVIAVLGLIILNKGRVRTSELFNQEEQELDNIAQQADQFIDEFNNIDESEDELDLTQSGVVDISDLDAMLNSAENAEKDVNNAISDFDSIKESEDQISF